MARPRKTLPNIMGISMAELVSKILVMSDAEIGAWFRKGAANFLNGCKNPDCDPIIREQFNRAIQELKKRQEHNALMYRNRLARQGKTLAESATRTSEAVKALADASTREGEDGRDHRGNTGTLESSSSAKTLSEAREAQARESLPAGERGKRSRAISRPVDAPAGSQAHAFGEFGLVKLTEQQATSLRTYYGTDFDRAVGILENYILSLPSKNDGDEKGNAKYWREDYAKRNHFAVMRRDNWVDNALKKAKAADTNLENANGRKSFQEKDRDDRSKWLNSSMFNIQEAV